MRKWISGQLLRTFEDAPPRTLVMEGGHYILAPWEKGGPVATKPTYWAVGVDGVALRIPRWLFDWLSK